MSSYTARSHWKVSYHVWQALFLREAVARLSSDRIAWLWLIAEPIAHVMLLVWVRTLVGHMQFIPGAEFVPWLVLGVTLFILFRNHMNRGMEAINANRGLFAYHQVHPVDTVLVRCFLEASISSVVILLLIAGFSLLGHSLVPAHPLHALYIWALVVGFGTGAGLVCSVIATTLPEAAKFIRMIMFPLYFLSGVMIPVQYFPHDLQYYLLFNPMLHAIELFRLGFFEGYRAVNGISVLYLHYWVWGSLFLGLLLQQRYKIRLTAQ